MMKRMLSLFLCLVMVLSMTPVQAFAQETMEEPTELVSETEAVELATEPADPETETVVETTALTLAENSAIGSGTPDSTPPVLHGLTLSATTVTIPGEIEVIVDASDDVSGATGGQVNFYCKETEKRLYCHLDSHYYDDSIGQMLEYADGKLHGTLEIDQYVETGTFVIREMYLDDAADNHGYYYNDEFLQGLNGIILPDALKQVKLQVMESNTPDGVPPTLNGLVLSAAEITAPGTVEVIVDASDDVSGVTQGQVNFYCKETDKILYCSLDSHYFDDSTWQRVEYADGKLHGILEIDQYVETGTFVIREMFLDDAADNHGYYYNDEFLQGLNGIILPDALKHVKLQVMESDTPDGTPPTLNGLLLSAAEISAPGTVEVIVDASDDVSGATGGQVNFYCKETEKILYCSLDSHYFDDSTWQRVEYADGKLHGILEIDQYVETGTFVIREMFLDDAADNHGYYYNDEFLQGLNGIILPDALKQIQLAVINTLPDVSTSVSRPTFVEEIANADDNAYIVADFSGDTTMPMEAFEAIAGTDKTLDLISEGITWRFEGSDITEEIKDIDLNVDIQKVEDDSSGSGDAIEEELGGNPGVVMKFPENGTLPGKATIQLKVDYAMKEYLGTETGLCVYYYNNQTGELELIAENLTVINDTYVEFEITHCSYYVLTLEKEEADTETNSGTCGENLTWEFNDTTKVLTISGHGPMTNFTVNGNWYGSTPTDTPWYTFKDQVLGIIIEHDVTTIGTGAFAGFGELIKVSLPDSLTSIGDYAFNGDVSLKGLVIPDSVTYLGDYAVCCCCTLAELTLPSGITRIGVSAIDQTWPHTLTIPAGVTIVESKAFAHGTIGEIIFTGNAPIFAEDAFYNQTTTVRYPKNNATWTETVKQNYGGRITWIAGDGAVSAPEPGEPTYATASGTWGNNIAWNLDSNGLLTISGSGKMRRFDEDPTMDFIPGRLYPWQDYADGITKLIVEEGITELNHNAFRDLSRLESVILPDSLLDMHDMTFTNCVKLKDVVFGSGISQIGQASFGSCASLTSITIPSNIKLIDLYAFDGCKNLKDVIILEGATEIAGMAFWGCSSLTNIDISSSVESIGKSAFESCLALTTLTVPSSVGNLDKHVFYNCKNLKDIYFEGDVPQFHPYALLNLTATAYFPVGNTTWTSDVMQSYGGNITWKPYCLTHSFNPWITEGNKASRTCTLCGYTEYQVNTDSGNVEIAIPEQPDLEVEVDPVRPSEDKYILIEEVLDGADDQDYAILKVFDITLKNADGVHVQPNGTVKVKLPLDWSKDGHYKVFRINDDRTLTDMQAYRQGSHMVFETDHFSLYLIVEEEHQPEVAYSYGQNVQIKLIEPWGIRANAKISTSAGVVDYDSLYDYGVYFIRKSALDREGLTQSTITVADIVNDADAQKQTKADGVTISSGYLSAIYDSDIYTYELDDSVFVMFYFITEEGADPIYIPVRERNLKTLAQQRMNDAASFPNALERDVYKKMVTLEADVTDYRSDFTSLSTPEKQKAPTLAQYPLGAQAAGSQYTYGQNAQIKLIEPWGLKANVKVSLNGRVIDYSTVEEYGMVVLADNSKVYNDASEILRNENAYVFSSKNGDASISGQYISATYSKDIYTYQLDTDIYVFGYVKDADGYHYGPVRNRNVHDLMIVRKDDAANFPNVKERTVYTDMIDLYTAITLYREDYFNN